MTHWNDSFHAMTQRIQDEDSMQCKICGYVYDPGLGDDLCQIEVGTPFTRLPEQWCCPECDAPKTHFLPLYA